MIQLSIILNQTCQSCIASDTDVLKDYILPIFLAGVAVISAYWIFVSESRRDKKREDAKKKEERSDKLLYLAQLVKSVISLTKQQKGYILEFTEEIAKEPTTFPLLTWVPIDDFRRINQNLNLEEYLLAYVNEFNLDRKKSIQEYRNIIDTIDSLYAIFNGILKQVEKAQTFDHERRITYGDLFKEAYHLAGDILTRHGTGGSFSTLETILIDFVNNRPNDNSNLDYYTIGFFRPVNDWAVAHLTITIAELKILARLTRDGKQQYSEIINQNNEFKEGLRADCDTIDSNLKLLEKDSQNILVFANI